jgi:hypothetical protein
MEGFKTGLPAFSCCNMPNVKKYTKLPQNIQNGGKIQQKALKVPKMAMKYVYPNFPFRGLEK